MDTKALEQAKVIFGNRKFQEDWIKTGGKEEMVEYTDYMSKQMVDKEVTPTQIRNLYGEIKRIQMNYANNQSSFYLLRPKVAYVVGRNCNNIGLNLFQLIFDKAYSCVRSKEEYDNFCTFYEALIAYHKYHHEINNQLKKERRN